ncbi:MAG: ATP-binding protein [Patescibacteria group bacterium]|nr:ATP-binding protein [Patescibacteria group bacterium]
MKKIAIISGKGGVGKSMLASSLAILFSRDKKKIIAVDCDVDAPNLAVWLNEVNDWEKEKKISVSEKPLIDNSKISEEQIEKCVAKCKFNALITEKGKLKLNYFLCEGCGACEFFCPKGAIKMKAVENGEIKIKNTKYNFPLVSGHLFPGETGSGKIVSEIKQQAEKFKKELMIIDSPPGTGCPVIASIQDADFVFLVTEPTLSGLSDLKRVLKVIEHFQIPWKLTINKWDINKKMSKSMEKWAGNNFLGKISYDKNIFKAISKLTPIVETSLIAKDEIKEIYSRLQVFTN